MALSLVIRKIPQLDLYSTDFDEDDGMSPCIIQRHAIIAFKMRGKIFYYDPQLDKPKNTDYIGSVGLLMDYMKYSNYIISISLFSLISSYRGTPIPIDTSKLNKSLLIK